MNARMAPPAIMLSEMLGTRNVLWGCFWQLGSDIQQLIARAMMQVPELFALLRDPIESPLPKLAEFYDTSSAKRLGGGSFGTVLSLQAIRPPEGNEHTEHAVKVVSLCRLPSQADEEALRCEIATLMELQHLHIVSIQGLYKHDADLDSETRGEPPYLCIAMPRVDGCPLTHILRGSQDSEPSASLDIQGAPLARALAPQLFSALAYMHDQRICHRDIWPENLLVSSSLSLTIIDLGCASYFVPNVICHDSGARQLNLNYASPEVYEAHAVQQQNWPGTPQQDCWAAGLVLGEVVEGCLVSVFLGYQCPVQQGTSLHRLFVQHLENLHQGFASLLVAQPEIRRTMQESQLAWEKESKIKSPGRSSRQSDSEGSFELINGVQDAGLDEENTETMVHESVHESSDTSRSLWPSVSRKEPNDVSGSHRSPRAVVEFCACGHPFAEGQWICKNCERRRQWVPSPSDDSRPCIYHNASFALPEDILARLQSKMEGTSDNGLDIQEGMLVWYKPRHQQFQTCGDFPGKIIRNDLANACWAVQLYDHRGCAVGPEKQVPYEDRSRLVVRDFHLDSELKHISASVEVKAPGIVTQDVDDCALFDEGRAVWYKSQTDNTFFSGTVIKNDNARGHCVVLLHDYKGAPAERIVCHGDRTQLWPRDPHEHDLSQWVPETSVLTPSPRSITSPRHATPLVSRMLDQYKVKGDRPYPHLAESASVNSQIKPSMHNVPVVLQRSSRLSDVPPARERRRNASTGAGYPRAAVIHSSRMQPQASLRQPLPSSVSDVLSPRQQDDGVLSPRVPSLPPARSLEVTMPRQGSMCVPNGSTLTHRSIGSVEVPAPRPGSVTVPRGVSGPTSRHGIISVPSQLNGSMTSYPTPTATFPTLTTPGVPPWQNATSASAQEATSPRFPRRPPLCVSPLRPRSPRALVTASPPRLRSQSPPRSAPLQAVQVPAAGIRAPLMFTTSQTSQRCSTPTPIPRHRAASPIATMPVMCWRAEV